jgi:hypothetical protein
MDRATFEYFNRTENAAEDEQCGYASVEAFAEVDTLTPEQVRRLAAMAITHHESEWSDRGRDLLRGAASVLGRLSKLERGEA